MANLVKRYALCQYETVVGEVVARCNRPCQGEYCLEHQAKISEIEGLEKEVTRIVRGRKV